MKIVIERCGKKTAIPLFLVGLASSFWPGLANGQLPPPDVLQRASQSVVKVHARECGGRAPNRNASGFLWPTPDQVVTALHVVAGCDQITVYSEKAGIRVAARATRVFKAADLALLHLDDVLNLPILQPASAVPSLHEDLVALGYPLDMPSLDSKNLKLSYGRARLREWLPHAVQRDVREAGVPSLELEVLRLQGHLLPGLSGAPIIDNSGRVVAVADGGLENGAVEISWGLPVRNLNSLIASTEVVTEEMVTTTSNLFAAELETQRGKEVACGDMVFTRLRSRNYGELAQTTDDPASLQFLHDLAELVELDTSRLTFDIYAHLESGATVAVPQGLEIVQSDGHCLVAAFDGVLQMRFAGYSSVAGVELLAEWDFHAQTYRPTGLQWALDPLVSYAAPRERWDGLKVIRRSYSGIDPNDPGLVSGLPTPVGSSFETYMQRNEAFAGVVVFNYNPDTWTPQTIINCDLVTPDAEQCRRSKEQTPVWIAMILGTFLSTFPIG